MSAALLKGDTWGPIAGWSDLSLSMRARSLQNDVAENRSRLRDSYRTVESLQIAKQSIVAARAGLAKIAAVQAQRRQLRCAS